jgi:hypothetical protein
VRGSSRPPGNPLATRGGDPVGTGPGGPALRPLDGIQVQVPTGRVVTQGREEHCVGVRAPQGAGCRPQRCQDKSGTPIADRQAKFDL